MYNFFKYFYTEEFDTLPFIRHCGRIYSLFEIKKLILSNLHKNSEIFLGGDDNFSFIINFFAGVFSKSEIHILNDNKKHSEEEFKKNFNSENELIFPKINPDEVKIFFSTSGTTGASKEIEKNLTCFLKEAKDIIKALEIKSGLCFASSSNLSHTYTLASHLFCAIESLGTVDTDKIFYPEQIEKDNLCFITTPSFLDLAEKFSFIPKKRPEIIVTAGSKLNPIIFNYIKIISKKAFDIYGCTETSVIGYKTDFYENFKTFNGIKILNSTPEFTLIQSDYSINREDKISDRLVLKEDGFELCGRTDRVLKIHEKRFSSDEIENVLNSHKFIDESYCFSFECELAALVQLNLKGLDELIKIGAGQMGKIVKSQVLSEFDIAPKFVKFTNYIKRNRHGKIDKKTAEGLFKINLSCPIPIKSVIREDFAEFKLFFHKNCNFFKGHFDGFPITPGVVQLFFANYFANIAFDKDFHLGQIKRIKFSNIIRPNSIVDLRLEIKENFLDFTYFSKDTTFSKGCLPDKNIFEEIKE